MLVAGVLGASICEGFDCNALTTNACGRSAWCKQPRGIWSVLGVLGVLRLANRRLERPNNRGLWRQWRQTAGCNALIEATNAYGQSAWSKFHTCGGPRRRPCLGEGRGRRIYKYKYIYIYMYVCMYACMHVCIYICIYIYTYIYVCMYVCMHVCMYIYMYIYIHICLFMYLCWDIFLDVYIFLFLSLYFFLDLYLHKQLYIIYRIYNLVYIQY